MAESKLGGFEQLSRILKTLPQNVENNVVQSAATAAMRVGQKAVKAVAPQHLDKQSPASKKYGTLKQNIRVIRLRRLQRGQKGSRIDTGKAFWGYLYQVGSRHQPSRPWFTQAVASVQEAIFKTFSERVGAGIVREVQKLKGNSK